MQVFSNKESIGTLSKTGNDTVQLTSSVITIGAKQYTTGNLVCDITISGVGGLDTGVEQSGKYYYIYTIVDSGILKLVCSLSEIQPIGFTNSKKVGAFVNDFNGDIEQVMNIGEQPDSYIRVRASTAPINFRSRFITIDSVFGIGIQFIDDGVQGSIFKVLENGLYNIMTSMGKTSFSLDFAITLNTVTTFLPQPSLVQSEALGYETTSAGFMGTIDLPLKLQINDEISVHQSNSSSAGSFGSSHRFAISKIGTNEIDWTQY